MKLSVSMSDEDLAIIDAYVRESGVGSRSAAVQHAVRLLRDERLEDDYTTAWEEWEASGEARAWESAAADGLR